MQRGEIWFAATPGGDRPVLILTRDKETAYLFRSPANARRLLDAAEAAGVARRSSIRSIGREARL